MTRNYATCILLPPSPVPPFRFLRLSGRIARTFDASFRPRTLNEGDILVACVEVFFFFFLPPIVPRA